MINFSERFIETLTIKSRAMVIGLKGQMAHTEADEKEGLILNTDFKL